MHWLNFDFSLRIFQFLYFCIPLITHAAIFIQGTRLGANLRLEFQKISKIQKKIEIAPVHEIQKVFHFRPRGSAAAILAPDANRWVTPGVVPS